VLGEEPDAELGGGADIANADIANASIPDVDIADVQAVGDAEMSLVQLA
jgi:hypothetical protein